MLITFDVETKSYADLRKVGQHAYSEDPTTDIICACWGIDDGPIREWWPALGMNPDTEELFDALADGAEIETHGIFEVPIWENILAARYMWPALPMLQYRDIMAIASYYSLPASLDRLANTLGFGGKDPEGARLITKYSKLHLKTAQLRIPDGSECDWVTWSRMTASEQERCPEAHELGGFYRDDFSRFVSYCCQDVLVEQACSDFLGPLPKRELLLWQLDTRVNQRGLCLDVVGINAAVDVVEQRAVQLSDEFLSITGGIKPTQRDQCLKWFKEQGIFLENMQKDYLNEVLDEWEIGQGAARRALQIRVEINKASTKKLDAMARQASRDGRARYQTRFHGAVTGRDTGSGFQPLNLVRSWEDVDPSQLVRDIVSYRDPRWLDCLYGDAMEAVSKAGRHWIVAEEGNEIMAGDYVSVEAVVLACLSGEDWKVDAFRDGKKIYELMGDKIHGLPPGTVTKGTHPDERQDGKTGELAFGYQGALNAWLKFDSSGRHSDERIIEICKSWRAEHPMISKSWYGSEDAMLEAVLHPGRTTGYRELGFQMVDEWLTMILPDGKRLWYYNAQAREQMPHWHQPKIKPECASGECGHKPRLVTKYQAVKGGRLMWVSTYGGKIMENATQAVSRQLLSYALVNLDDLGFPTTLKVYDEIVGEQKIGFMSTEDFEGEMIEPLQKTFASTWPIRADAWSGKEYKK